MMTNQNLFIPWLGGSEDGFMYWTAQIIAILKAKQVWVIVRADDAGSLSSFHQVQASDKGFDESNDP